jgi:hypothetical protein
LRRYRRVLGDEHPNTLSAAHNLAVVLTSLNEHEYAMKLNEATMNRQRKVLGEDHPDTLASV